jgi:hypothetical protein
MEMLRRRPEVAKASLPHRVLRRETDGSLYDVDERRPISVAELCDDLRAGRYFRATRSDSGANCTNEVLAEVIQGAVPDAKNSTLESLFPVLRTMGGGLFGVPENLEHTRGEGDVRG